MIIGFVGFIGSGKGAAGDILSEMGYTKESFAKGVKDTASVMFGWDRKLLEGDTEEIREKYFQELISRLEQKWGQSIADSIVYKKSYAISDFINDYHSFKGNAYGLANTLLQTAILKPSCKSKKVNNLFYTGQLTVPGPGVPPSLISGEVVAGLIDKNYINLQSSYV